MQFKDLFGIPESSIQETCLLTPFLTQGLLKYLKLRDFSKGKPYSSGNNQFFTLIHTRIGPAYIGDAVLHLKNTPCQRLILWGACGLVRTPDTSAQKLSTCEIGTLVIPEKTYEMESFSQLLLGQYSRLHHSFPDKTFLSEFVRFTSPATPVRTHCATTGSLQLETTYLPFFQKKNIHIVDMECSAFFNSARYIKRKALALFYITDILNERHIFTPLTPTETIQIKRGADQGLDMIIKFLSAQKPGDLV